MKKQMSNESYNQYVTDITPKHSLIMNCINAFITGGIICTIGEGISKFMTDIVSLSKEDAASYASLILVLISVILTGFNLYKKIAKWGGAGALVPITGFANSVASPTIEFQKEGEVFGKGVKVFTIAGPVILFGILTSWALGVIYYILTLCNIL